MGGLKRRKAGGGGPVNGYDIHLVAGQSNGPGGQISSEVIAGIYNGTWFAPSDPTIDVWATASGRTGSGAFTPAYPIDTVISGGIEQFPAPDNNSNPWTNSPPPNAFPHIGAVSTMLRQLPAPAAGRKKLIVMCNVGGTSLASANGNAYNWQPQIPHVTLNTWDYNTDAIGADDSGKLYNFAVTRYKNAKASLAGNVIKSVLWQFGEAEGSTGVGFYDFMTAARLFITRLRIELEDPTIPFIIGPIHSDYATDYAGATQATRVILALNALQFAEPYCYKIPQFTRILDPNSKGVPNYNDHVHHSAVDQVTVIGPGAATGLPIAVARAPAVGTAPVAVVGASITATTTDNSCTITFPRSTTAGYYKVELSLHGLNTWVNYTTKSALYGESVDGTTNTPTCFIPSLLPSTDYDILVTAYNWAGSTPSAIKQFTSGAYAALPTGAAFTCQLLFEEATPALCVDTSGNGASFAESDAGNKISLVSVGGARGKVLNAIKPGAYFCRVIPALSAVQTGNTSFCSWFMLDNFDDLENYVLSTQTASFQSPCLRLNATRHLELVINNIVYVTDPNQYPIGSWHHVAVIANLGQASQTPRSLNLLVDGVPVAPEAVLSVATSWFLTGSNVFTLFNRLNTGATNIGLGNLDDTRYSHNTAWSTAQVASIIAGNTT